MLANRQRSPRDAMDVFGVQVARTTGALAVAGKELACVNIEPCPVQRVGHGRALLCASTIIL
jgi:hypothetical protein